MFWLWSHIKICISVHKEAKKRWKSLQKASNDRLDILIICQKKLDFISIIYTFKITENKKMASAKVWAPFRVNTLYCPLWQVSQLVNAFVASQESFNSCLRYLCPFFLTKVFQFFEISGLSVTHCFLRSIHRFSIMLRSGDCEGHGKTFSLRLLM